ncbi:uncharacterized protein LOC124353029 [Homalodisca vitripennis]|uniref:uncharacterized protein LOC124353029 n=1 Tax=Homalodisca vitripennis TaxID=197043 RepID=UPI001EEBFF96|nr:uncharacterized protein LOC124353029 [Homalodisca vitripennis]
MGMLKKNYSAMEQKITVLEMEVQSLQKIKTSKSTGGKSGELNKSSNSSKTFGRRPDLGHSKNVFSVSMQVKKMKENSLYPVKLPDITSQSQEVHLSGKEGETDRLSLNESGMWILIPCGYAPVRYQTSGDQKVKELMVQKKKVYDLRLRAIKRSATSQHITQAQNKPREVINAERHSKQPRNHKLEILLDSKLEKDPETIANEFNKYFSQIAGETLKQKPQHDIPDSTQRPSINHSTPFRFRHVSSKDVKDAIASLKPKLSFGIDVKHCAQQLAVPIASIINKSFAYSLFPTALKVSKIYPLHKKGLLTEIKNFRPISLISPFSKIIEKIVLTQLLAYLKHEQLLSEDQHGFLKGKSTASALTSIIEFVIDQLDTRKHVSAILLDYSKAFDCLGHEQILKELEVLGVNDKENAWFASYLKGRTQIVEVQKMLKGTKYIFLLKNDSAQGLFHDSLSTLEKVINYTNHNDLVLNASKTVHINFSRLGEPALNLPGVTSEEETKLLGVTLHDGLTWTSHIDSLCRKLSSGVYVIRRIHWVGGLIAAKSAYYSMMESHIRYGITVWGGTSESNLNRILLLQKKAIRALANLQPLDSCREAFESLGILTVVALYIQTIILETLKCDLPRGENIHTHNTRNATNYVLPSHRTAQFQRKPSYIGRKLYNALPTSLKALGRKSLAAGLLNWLKSRPLYSMKEFFEAAQQ